MRTIYIDSDFKCHIANDGTMAAIKTDFFNGMCDTFIEGYCYDTSKGYVQIYPWKPYNELDSAQREYEKQLIIQYETELAELDAALLETQYQNLIGGIQNEYYV